MRNTTWQSRGVEGSARPSGPCDCLAEVRGCGLLPVVTRTPPSREEGWEGNLVGSEGGHRGALRPRGGLGAVGSAGLARARGCVCKGPGVRAGWASSASAVACSLRHHLSLTG